LVYQEEEALHPEVAKPVPQTLWEFLRVLSYLGKSVQHGCEVPVIGQGMINN
jgi:hypothetical protein